jgi:hypothetical protein
VLNTAFYGVAVVCALAVPVLIFNWVKYLRGLPRAHSPLLQQRYTELHLTQFPTKSVIFFAAPIALAFGIAGAATERAKAYVHGVVDLASSDAHIFVNGESPSNVPEVLASLKSMHWEMGHHSHPTTRISVDVQASTGDHIFLVLGRDSSIPTEYWVFYPKYAITSNNELGRIRTNAFDRYQ